MRGRIDVATQYFQAFDEGHRVEFQGCPMKTGDYVVMPVACANRDERVFDGARVFDHLRPKNRHIAFGIGAHRCVGSHLPRVELYAAIDVCHQLMPPYRHIAGASRSDYVVAVSGPRSVDIEWSRPDAL